MKCPKCGSEMIQTGENVWRCRKCGLRIVKSAVVKTKIEKKVRKD